VVFGDCDFKFCCHKVSTLKKNPSHKLVIVEGLTGSGKSITAHFIARQFRYHGFNARWIHEGELQHPVGCNEVEDVNRFTIGMRQKWEDFASHIQAADEITVIEASFYNNLFETMYAHNVDFSIIIQFSLQLQEVIRPLKPVLIYLTQANLPNALEKNFGDRGEGFKNFVIEFATGTPYARGRNLVGYDGMVAFWRGFETLTDKLFAECPIDKLMIDVSSRDWVNYHQQITHFLSIPLIPEKTIPADEAARYVGTYLDEKRDREFDIKLEDQKLTANIFLKVRTPLIYKEENVFLTEGWHFEIRFLPDEAGAITKLVIEGRDIDYLSLVGTKAVKKSW
jgi:hypothetical protein